MLKKRPKSIDSQFLIRVIRNEVSPEENEYFLSWLSDSEKNKEEFGNIALVWDLADQVPIVSFPDVIQQWNEIQKTLSETNSPQEITLSRQPNIFTSDKLVRAKNRCSSKMDNSWLFRAAAVIIISLGLSYLIQIGNNYKKPQIDSFTEQTKPALYELITQKGERKTFLLADGTTVYLNSGSKLNYPKFFSETAREVEIVGEAYFSVKPDKEKPFLVRSGKMITEVTGTEFNVCHRNDKVNVVVSKGSVKTFLDDSDHSINLIKGQMVSYSERGGFSSPKRVNLKNYLAWRDNKFFFEHTSLKEVMAEIERYYNLEIVYSNETAMDKLLTGVFDNDSLEQILSVISLTLDVQIDYKGNRVSIK